jgi:hypothetical protein
LIAFASGDDELMFAVREIDQKYLRGGKTVKSGPATAHKLKPFLFASWIHSSLYAAQNLALNRRIGCKFVAELLLSD